MTEEYLSRHGDHGGDRWRALSGQSCAVNEAKEGKHAATPLSAAPTVDSKLFVCQWLAPRAITADIVGVVALTGCGKHVPGLEVVRLRPAMSAFS